MFKTFSGNWKIGKALNLARNEFGVDIDRVTGIVSRPTDPMAATLRAETRRMIDELQMNDKELAAMLVLPFVDNLPHGTRRAIGERLAFWLNLGVVRWDIVEPLLQELE